MNDAISLMSGVSVRFRNSTIRTIVTTYTSRIANVRRMPRFASQRTGGSSRYTSRSPTTNGRTASRAIHSRTPTRIAAPISRATRGDRVANRGEWDGDAGSTNGGGGSAATQPIDGSDVG